MTFLQFIKSKVFWLNVLLAVVVTFVLIMLLMWALTVYTRSGRTVIVPDVKGYKTNQISHIMESVDLDYVVIDSIHVSDAVPGAIVEQIPRAGKEVKKGRKIFLTINAYTNEMVTMPRLIDVSLRAARVVLENSGLKLGRVVYRPSEYKDLVLSQLVDGKEIKEGTKVPKNTQVQLVVGSYNGNNNVFVPSLIGLTLAEAGEVLNDGSLKVGAVFFDETVVSSSDSTMAVVFRQNPSSIDGETVVSGSNVTVWLTKNNDLVIDAMEEIENAKQE